MRRILQLKKDVSSLQGNAIYKEVKSEISAKNKEIKVLREFAMPWWEQNARETLDPEDTTVLITVGDDKVTFKRTAVKPTLLKTVAKAPGACAALDGLPLDDSQKVAVCEAVFDLQSCGAEHCAKHEQWRRKWGMTLPACRGAKTADAAAGDSASVVPSRPFILDHGAVSGGAHADTDDDMTMAGAEELDD